MIAAYKTFHVTSSFFAEPIEIKINFEDQYIRVAAPIHEVIQFDAGLFNHQHLIVSNLYGVPLFRMDAHGQQGNLLDFHFDNHQHLKVAFNEAEPVKGNLQSTNGKLPVLVQFEIMENMPLTSIEKQMIGAAIVACQQHQANAGVTKKAYA